MDILSEIFIFCVCGLYVLFVIKWMWDNSEELSCLYMNEFIIHGNIVWVLIFVQYIFILPYHIFRKG